MVEQIDATVVEWIGQAVARSVDGDDAVLLRESREDRYDLECAAQPTVDVQKRRACAELEELCLALRPADSANVSIGREPGEQRRLRLLEFPIQLRLHVS